MLVLSLSVRWLERSFHLTCLAIFIRTILFYADAKEIEPQR